MPKYFAHESSFIDNDVEIGEDTKVWHFSHILSGSKIGKKCFSRDKTKWKFRWIFFI